MKSFIYYLQNFHVIEKSKIALINFSLASTIVSTLLYLLSLLAEFCNLICQSKPDFFPLKHSNLSGKQRDISCLNTSIRTYKMQWQCAQ